MSNIFHNTVSQPFTYYSIIPPPFPYSMIFPTSQIIPPPSGSLQHPIIPIPVRLNPVVNPSPSGPSNHLIRPIPVLRPTPIRVVTERSCGPKLARGSAVSFVPNLEATALESTSSKIDSLASSSLASQDPELSTNSRHAFHVVVRNATSSNLTNKALVTAVDNPDQSSSNGVASKLVDDFMSGLKKRHLATGEETTSSTMIDESASNSSISSSKRARIDLREAKDSAPLSNPSELEAWDTKYDTELSEKCKLVIDAHNAKAPRVSFLLDDACNYFERRGYTRDIVVVRIKALNLLPGYFENLAASGLKTQWTPEEDEKLIKAYKSCGSVKGSVKYIANTIFEGRKTPEQVSRRHKSLMKKKQKAETSINSMNQNGHNLATEGEIAPSASTAESLSSSSTAHLKTVGDLSEVKGEASSSPAEVKTWNDRDTTELIKRCQSVMQRLIEGQSLSILLRNTYNYFKRSYSRSDVKARIRELNLFPEHFKGRTAGGQKTIWTPEENEKLIEAYKQYDGRRDKCIIIAKRVFNNTKTSEQVRARHTYLKNRTFESLSSSSTAHLKTVDDLSKVKGQASSSPAEVKIWDTECDAQLIERCQVAIKAHNAKAPIVSRLLTLVYKHFKTCGYTRDVVFARIKELNLFPGRFEGRAAGGQITKWTSEEIKTLLDAYKTYDDVPNKCQKIAQILPGKTPAQISYKYQRVIEQRKKKEQGMADKEAARK